MHICSFVEARHHGKCSPSHYSGMQITATKYPNTNTLCNMKAFCTFGVTMGSLNPTQKQPSLPTDPYELPVLWVESCWMTLIQPSANVLRLNNIQCCGVLAGRYLLGKSPLSNVWQNMLRNWDIVLYFIWTWYEQKFGKAACEGIKYWSGCHFSRGIFPP